MKLSTLDPQMLDALCELVDNWRAEGREGSGIVGDLAGRGMVLEVRGLELALAKWKRKQGEEALLSKGVGLPLPLDAEGEVDEIAAGGDGGRGHGGNRGILTESATMDAWEVTSLIPAPRGRLGTVPYTTIIAAPSFPHVLKWIAEWLPANGKDTQTIRKLGRVGAVLIETSTGAVG